MAENMRVVAVYVTLTVCVSAILVLPWHSGYRRGIDVATSSPGVKPTCGPWQIERSTVEFSDDKRWRGQIIIADKTCGPFVKVQRQEYIVNTAPLALPTSTAGWVTPTPAVWATNAPRDSEPHDR